jgi:hypothetical protein
MATIKTKLKQLRNADVRYISLVDRAATRIPFRVLKRNKESKMGIDLTKVFKSENTDKPYVSALVVFAQKNEAAGNQVQDAIKKYGFKTDKVQKSDDGETLVYAQQEAKGETMVVRLSDQLLVTVGGLRTPEGWVGALVEENGFFPDLKLATAALHEQMALVAKSDSPQEDAQAALEHYGSYLQQMFVLPSNAYALDEAIGEVIKKCSCEEKTEVMDETKTEVTKESEEDEAARKKRQKSHPPAEMAPADEDADQEPPPPDEDAKKADVAILAALKDIGTTVAGLSTKLETVVTEQASQKKVLDEVVQKADTLGTKLGTTLTAPPVSEDRPAPARMRVTKDEDPRTGNFDTAFLRRRRS